MTYHPDQHQHEGTNIPHLATTLNVNSLKTRMLAINVSIRNMTVACLEQFRLLQLHIQREQPRRRG